MDRSTDGPCIEGPGRLDERDAGGGPRGQVEEGRGRYPESAKIARPTKDLHLAVSPVRYRPAT
ncbi:MAG: hypothetical protein WKF75_04750, partial [Singulisphaera sp.]